MKFDSLGCIITKKSFDLLERELTAIVRGDALMREALK